jgi:hypothetical protein
VVVIWSRNASHADAYEVAPTWFEQRKKIVDAVWKLDDTTGSRITCADSYTTISTNNIWVRKINSKKTL